MTNRKLHLLLFCLLIHGLGLVLVGPAPVIAQGASPALSDEFARWTVNGSVMHQVQSDLDRGGNFGVNRYFINGRWSHPINSRLSFGVGLRYAYEDYSFSDNVGLSGRAPWGDVHMPDLSLAAFYRSDSGWRFLGAATGGISGESGADTGDAIIYGGILAASKRFGPDLTLGLGAGIYRRFEETTFFPPGVCQMEDFRAVVVGQRPAGRAHRPGRAGGGLPAR